MIDIRLSKELKNDGYVVFDLLNMNQVTELLTFLETINCISEGTFIATSHHKDYNLRQQISDKISEVIETTLLSISPNSRLLGSSFLVKKPGESGIVNFHRDWNIVDERVENSFNLWISLTKSTLENGTLILIRNSHLLNTGYRGPGIIEASYPINYQRQNQVPIILNPGQAVLYNHKLIHGSLQNNTHEPRINIVGGVVHMDANLRIFYPSSSTNTVLMYECYPEFFFKSNPTEGQKELKLLEEIIWKNDQINWLNRVKKLIYK